MQKFCLNVVVIEQDVETLTCAECLWTVLALKCFWISTLWLEVHLAVPNVLHKPKTDT